MGKRKEIKFLCKDGQTREGRQDGVMFWIRKDQKREQDGLPAFYVAANDIKGKGRTIYTAGHEYFTLEGAKELCQQIMAGEANLAERKARYAAEDIEKERRAGSCTMRRTAFPLRACGSAAWWRKSPPPWRGGGRHMAERNDMTAAMVTAYTSPQLAAINEYMEAEKAVRTAAETLGLDADLMIAEAEGLARATTFSNVEALYFVADQATSGKREVNGRA